MGFHYPCGVRAVRSGYRKINSTWRNVRLAKEVLNLAIDPICKMTVDEKTAKFTSEYKGKKYYFCAPGCKKKFDTDPAKYAS
jgi:YHS domain-containing protein